MAKWKNKTTSNAIMGLWEAEAQDRTSINVLGKSAHFFLRRDSHEGLEEEAVYALSLRVSVVTPAEGVASGRHPGHPFGCAMELCINSKALSEHTRVVRGRLHRAEELPGGQIPEATVSCASELELYSAG